MITLDTAGVLAALNLGDPHHKCVMEALKSEKPPLVLPVAILSELCYMIESWLGAQTLQSFLSETVTGVYELYWSESDLPRVVELTEKYSDLPLGFADAAVIACAERHGGRVLTVDYRDFSVVAGEGSIELVPEVQYR